MFDKTTSSLITFGALCALAFSTVVSAQDMLYEYDTFEERMEEAPRNYSEKSYSKVNIPDTNAWDYRVVEVEFKGRPAAEVYRPEAAFFYIDGHEEALRYHYVGEEEGVYKYLTAVPEQFTGEVTIHGLFGARPVDFPIESESRDSLVVDRRVVGAPDVALLVDESGSMGSNVSGGMDRTEIAEQVVNNLVPDLEEEGSRVAVIGYDSGTRIALGLEEDYSRLSFSHSGGTGTHKAVDRARDILNGSGSRAKVIIDITDGVASSPDATASEVSGAENSGMAVAAIGMGQDVPDYYPYSDYVTDSAANFQLENELSDLIKTTEERARDIEAPCEEGGLCYAEPLDEIDPTVELSTSEGDGIMRDPTDLELSATDRHSGINPEQVTATMKVGSQTFSAPFIQPEGVNYMLEVNGSQGARQVDFALDKLELIDQAGNALIDLGDESRYIARGQNAAVRVGPVGEFGSNDPEAEVTPSKPLTQPSAHDGPVAAFGVGTPFPGSTYENILQSSQRVDLSTVARLSYQVNRGASRGSSWGDPPDTRGSSPDESLWLQYSVDGKTWEKIDEVGVREIPSDTWVNRDVIVPEGAKADGGVLLRFYQPGSRADDPPRDNWAFTDLLVSEQSSQDTQYIEALIDAYLNDRPIEVTARVRDMEGNTTTITEEFDFQPPEHTAEAVKIASVDHAFSASDGGPTLNLQGEDLLTNSAPSKASVTYFATLSGSNEALDINGAPVSDEGLIEIGSTTASDALRAALKPENPGGSDQGEILLMPSNAFGKVVRVPFHLWDTALPMKSSNEEPVQGLSNVEIAPDNNTPCLIAGNRAVAKTKAAPEAPRCVIEWTQIPDELYESGAEDAGALTGVFADDGVNAGEYRVLLADNGADFVEIHNGEIELDVRRVEDALEIGMNREPDEVMRLVEDMDLRLIQKAGPNCMVFQDEDEALRAAGRNRPTCLVQWESTPLGMDEVIYRSEPSIEGNIQLDREPDATFEWSTKVILPSGKEVDLPNGTHTVDLVDPPAPEIEYNIDKVIEESLFGVSQNGGTVGDVMYEGAAADMTVEISRNGEVVEEKNFQGADTSGVMRRSRITAPAANLWNRDTYTVKAFYDLLPRVEAESSFDVLSVPPDSLRLDVEASKTEILDTESMEATVTLDAPFSDEGYTPETMGEWDARMINQISQSRVNPLTEEKRLGSSGSADYSFDIGELDAKTMRLSAEATVESPVDSYEKTITATRPVFITVLRGGAIEADLEARQVEGPAPLQVIASAELRDRLDYEAVDEVRWEIKHGDGEWEEVENEGSFAFRYSTLFNEGTHALRAKITNRYSDEEFVTQALEVHAFSTPEVKIEGPGNAFIGDEARFTVTDLETGEAVDPSELVIEWSQDGGSTWAPGGVEYAVSRNERTDVSLAVRVRSAEAPDGNEEAWLQEDRRVSFQPVRKPGARLYGPQLVEVDKEERWEGRSRPPYRDMDVEIVEEIIMPDGTVVNSKDIEYTPTTQDAVNEMLELTYRAWVKGYRDQGAVTEDTQRVKVWDYKWPQWDFSVRKTAEQAPADVEMRLRALDSSIRTIEGMEVEWIIPPSIQITEDRRPESRSLSIEEPGQYTVIANVSDERGNYSTIRKDLNIAPADEWSMDMQLIPSNEFNRAPLSVRTRPEIGGGHPRDRVEGYRYLVDGAIASEGSRYSEVTLDEGVHDVTLEIETSFGEVARHTETIEVAANEPPVCGINVQERRSGWRFNAECTDPDGRVSDYIWTINGEELAQGGSRISVRSRDTSNRPLVELIGIDDAGAQSAPVQANYTSNEADEDDRDDNRADESNRPEAELGDWQVELELRPSNSEMVAPLRLDARPNIDGPRTDEAVDYRYYVNGELVSEGDEYPSFELDAGSHEIRLEVETAAGLTPSASGQIEVKSADTPAQDEETRDDAVRADDWSIDLELRPGNREMLAPLRIDARPDVDGPRNDEEVDYRYYVDGELISEGDQYPSFELEAGDHEVKLEVETEAGLTPSVSKTVTVNAAPAPEEDSAGDEADASDEQAQPDEDYVWPDFQLDFRKGGEQAPAAVTVSLDALEGSVRRIEGLSIDWQLPQDAQILRDRRATRRTIGIGSAGEHQIEALVSDAYGNEATVSGTVTLQPADPWQVDFQMSPAREDLREPLEVRLRSDVDGGHPDDRVDTYAYRVNGDLVSERRNAEVTLPAGSHEIELIVGTELGKSPNYIKRIEVAENQAPSCTIESTERRSGWRLEAVCNDPDGDVEDYAWRVNGEPIRSGQSHLTLRLDEYAEKPDVEVIVTDDAGDRSAPAVW